MSAVVPLRWMAGAVAVATLLAWPAAAMADGAEATANGIGLPEGYRGWGLIAVAREEGRNDDIRAVLGNAAAVDAAREGRPYPDGAILARLAWSYDALPESAQAFGQAQSHVSGPAKNGVQLMVRNAVKYAATGGWGYAQFDGGKPSAASPAPCFACHTVVKDRGYVFNRYAP